MCYFFLLGARSSLREPGMVSQSIWNNQNSINFMTATAGNDEKIHFGANHETFSYSSGFKNFNDDAVVAVS